MSIYDFRDKPAYKTIDVKEDYCQNKSILAWWSELHDDLINILIQKYQWNWFWEISDEVIKTTPNEIIENWKSSDPLCSAYAFYNVLMYFAISRANSKGYHKSIRDPEWRNCAMCKNQFVENSLPQPIIKRLGIENLDICSPCFSLRTFMGYEDNGMAKSKIIEYLQNLTEAVGRVPPQNFGCGVNDFLDLDTEERVKILRILGNRPTLRRVKKVFGTWLNALIQAGILENATRKTSRGTQCIAKDGHLCLSLGEKTIDDFLFVNGIAHEKEVYYPEKIYRTDYCVGNIFIEYFGLHGNSEYDKKSVKKKSICKKHGIPLIEIYPKDLLSQKRLKNKLKILLKDK